MSATAATPEDPVITWPTPVAITYGTVLGPTQLNAKATYNGVEVPGTFVYAPAKGAMLTAGSQTLAVTFTPTNPAAYTSASAAVVLQVNQGKPKITWKDPVAITYGTVLSSTQLDAAASVAGALVYSPASGTVLTAGTHTLWVTFTPTDSTDYATASYSVPFTVRKATPNISWATPAAIAFGTRLSSVQLDATASVSGEFKYSPAAGAMVGAGSHTLSVAFYPTDATDYITAMGKAVLTVNPATPTIDWPTPAPITYGTALSAAQLNAKASVNGSSVAGVLSYSPAKGTVLSAGSRALWVTFTPSNTIDYAAANTTVVLQVEQGSRAPSQNQLITISGNGQYLVNSVTGNPVFVVGDDAFDLAVMLDSSDVTTYLNDRASRGFNAIWMTTVDNGYQPNPPKNYYGYSPFDGADFTNEDTNYWANVDSVIQQASSLGITVFLQPFFVGNGSNFGYYSSVQSTSDEVLTAYGTFLGERYAGYDNIVWLLGGDSFPSDAGLYAKFSVLGTAIAIADPNHLITLEACEKCVTNGYNSVSGFQASGIAVPSWLALNWAYPQYTTTVAAVQNAYTQTPFLPPLAGENFYELENSMTEPGLRFEMYSEILSGAYLGRIFGNGAIWSFDSPNGSSCCTSGSPTWQSELGSAGSEAQALQGTLFRSREFWLLVPDINHTVVTAGYGSGQSITTAARTSDGQTIIAYIPNGNATTITVAMTQISSATNLVQAWWFNPTTGATTNLGTFSNTGTQNFTAPNSSDWVLVLDDASANLPAP